MNNDKEPRKLGAVFFKIHFGFRLFQRQASTFDEIGETHGAMRSRLNFSSWRTAFH
jgi:hypothetical protein